MFKHFPESLTEDEARQLRKKLAREYHPDVVGDAGARMSEINAEYDRWVRFKQNPPIFVPAPTSFASGTAWWSAMVGAVKQVPVPDPGPQPRPAPRTAPAPAPPPQPTPAPRTRPTRAPRPAPPGPRVPAAQREQEDYDAAVLASPDAHGHRVYGVITILYTSYLPGMTIEAIEIRGGRPRHQIRENGAVMFERPASQSWRQERKDVIARASARNY